VAIDAIGNTKTQLKSNMENLLARDEKLDDMMRKTSEMSDLSYSISRKVLSADQSRKVHRNLFWSSMIAKILYVIIGIVLLYFILFFFCDGLTLPKCH